MNDANFELLTGYATPAGTKKYADIAVKDKGRPAGSLSTL